MGTYESLKPGVWDNNTGLLSVLERFTKIGLIHFLQACESERVSFAQMVLY